MEMLPRCCREDVDLIVSAINIPMPRQALKPWSREDLHVRVFQGYALEAQRTGKCAFVKPSTWRQVLSWHVNTLIPERALVVFPHTRPGCSPCSSHALSIRSVLWCSELDLVPESIRVVAARCRARAGAFNREARPVVVLRGVIQHKHKPERHHC